MVFRFDDPVRSGAFAGDIAILIEGNLVRYWGIEEVRGLDGGAGLQVDDLAFFVLHFGEVEGICEW